MGKTEVLISNKNLHSLRDSAKHPCCVCRKGVGSNSILYTGCQLWMHKKCSGIKGKLTADPSIRVKDVLVFANKFLYLQEVNTTLNETPLTENEFENFLNLSKEIKFLVSDGLDVSVITSVYERINTTLPKIFIES